MDWDRSRRESKAQRDFVNHIHVGARPRHPRANMKSKVDARAKEENAIGLGLVRFFEALATLRS